MELFLTSSVHAVAHSVAQKVDLKENNRLVFIDTAAEPKMGDKTWLKNDRLALVDAGFAVTDYTITDKTKDQLQKDLMGYQFIYLSGGDTIHLLNQSKMSGFVDLVHDLIEKQNKIYISTSAGSIIAGPEIPYYLTDERGTESGAQKGYGFVNFTIVPHWGSDDFREKYLSNRLKIAYEKYYVPLVLLRDEQYVHVKDDQIKIVSLNK